jgi:UDP-N-acetyl-D-galactosamine dehydrogenase
VKKEYNLRSQNTVPEKRFDVIVLAVSHTEFSALDLEPLKKEKAIVYDVKNFLSSETVDKYL